jgi:hypothetical protein
MSSNIASAAPLALALVLAGLSSAHAQAPAEPAERPFGIVKSDP